MIHPAILVALSYLIGSIPAAYLAGKLTRGIDLREHGSGNLGATNVYRVLGPRMAIVVLLVDALKGAIPVLVLPGITAASRPGLWQKDHVLPPGWMKRLPSLGMRPIARTVDRWRSRPAGGRSARARRSRDTCKPA